MSKFAHKQVNRRSVLKGAAATGLGLGAASSVYLPTVMVSHHLEELPTSTSHVMLLRDGAILAAGEITQVLTPELVSECFGFPIEVHEMHGRYAARAAAGWT